MPDPDMRDPLDQAYVQAETLLSDEEARAERRARVLAAVEAETLSASSPAKRSRGLHPGWGAAAAAVVVSVAVVATIPRPVSVRQPPPTAPTTAPSVPSALAPAAVPDAAVGTPAPRAPAPSEKSAAPGLQDVRAPETVARPALQAAPSVIASEPPSVADSATPPPLPLPQMKAATAVEAKRAAPAAEEAPAPAPSTFAARDRVQAQGASALSTGHAAPSASGAVVGSDAAGRLRAAAAAGRTDEVAALLAQGVPVDAPDADGETALMTSVRADQPATARLLSRHGASLDRTNKAGESAKTLAAARDDKELSKALNPNR